MNRIWKKLPVAAVTFLPLGLALLVVSGCRSTEPPQFSSAPGFAVDDPLAVASPSAGGASIATNPATASATGLPMNFAADMFRRGDLVRVVFSGTSEPIPIHEERIKEDGTITLSLIGAVPAAGRSAGELQREIHDLYVPRYYRRLTITVMAPERVYYVGGEVKAPGRQAYLSETTVTKAIQTAGDFTDWANRGKVTITRADGKTVVTVNCKRAISDPTYDVPVYPGDKIHVPRRRW